MSDKKTGDDDFRRLLSNHSCDCNNKNCRELLRRYFYDSSSCYPNNKKQLLYRLTNPSKSGGKVQPKRQQRQQQVYNRAAFLLKVEKAHDKDYIHIGIIHYSPHVIHHYNNDVSDRKEKVFTDYLLPSSLVSNSKLGVKFTSVDKFNCIGTTKELSMCRKNNGKCKCNRYMNAPFVSGTTNVIVNTSSARGKRKQTFSDGRKISMSSAEAEVQGTRADRYKKENERLKTEVKDKDNKLTKTKSELESVKKQLDYAKKVKSPLLKQVSSLKRDTERLERDREQLYVEKEKLAEKEERSSKKAKRHYDINRRSASPTDANGRIPLDELKRMGLCRRSLLDRSWHAHFDEASRSLLNFESFDECMGYIGILFPQLRDEIATLNRVGAEQYVSNTRLTPLEHCLLCRASPKMGITDKQIGFIYGIKAPAVSKIKKKWMPLWGYAGKQLTDLELYDDYVDKERPDAYYENDLPDMGTQCDGKDFLCESFRRSSSLNRAQRSSKVKHAALRCITWTSLCGLVWAFTPLVLARLTENALVHWYGEFKDGDDMYVPISMSDWTVSSDEDEHDDDGEEEGDDDAEETMVVSIERVNERDNQLEHHDEDEDEDEQQSDDDKDERIKECYEDMDDMSLSGRSEDGSEDGAFEQEEDGCIDLDKELEKFDKELLDKNKDKKLISKDLLRINEINAMAQEVLNSGPDRNGKAKLEQLEMLQELHVEYEEGRLKRCLLSMYLKLTVHHREKLIKQLQMYRDGKLEDPPKIPRRLAKLSRSYKVLADRGFDGDNLSYPHFNMVVTPEFYDKESKQFTLAQLERDRKICELRYTCEVVFSRVTTERMLGGVIPYSAFAHIEDAHCWAHAQANLRQPLQTPGSASGLGHYFDEYEECRI